MRRDSRFSRLTRLLHESAKVTRVTRRSSGANLSWQSVILHRRPRPSVRPSVGPFRADSSWKGLRLGLAVQPQQQQRQQPRCSGGHERKVSHLIRISQSGREREGTKRRCPNTSVGLSLCGRKRTTEMMTIAECFRSARARGICTHTATQSDGQTDRGCRSLGREGGGKSVPSGGSNG